MVRIVVGGRPVSAHEYKARSYGILSPVRSQAYAQDCDTAVSERAGRLGGTSKLASGRWAEPSRHHELDDRPAVERSEMWRHRQDQRGAEGTHDLRSCSSARRAHTCVHFRARGHRSGHNATMALTDAGQHMSTRSMTCLHRATHVDPNRRATSGWVLDPKRERVLTKHEVAIPVAWWCNERNVAA